MFLIAEYKSYNCIAFNETNQAMMLSIATNEYDLFQNNTFYINLNRRYSRC